MFCSWFVAEEHGERSSDRSLAAVCCDRWSTEAWIDYCVSLFLCSVPVFILFILSSVFSSYLPHAPNNPEDPNARRMVLDPTYSVSWLLTYLTRGRCGWYYHKRRCVWHRTIDGAIFTRRSLWFINSIGLKYISSSYGALKCMDWAGYFPMCEAECTIHVMMSVDERFLKAEGIRLALTLLSVVVQQQQ